MIEENTCLETHLRRMLNAYEYLTEVWQGVADDSFAMKAVLRSLPPSYKEIKDIYIPQVDRLSFNEFLRELMMIKVKPIAGENRRSSRYICYTYYKCFPNMFAILSI